MKYFNRLKHRQAGGSDGDFCLNYFGIARLIKRRCHDFLVLTRGIAATQPPPPGPLPSFKALLSSRSLTVHALGPCTLSLLEWYYALSVSVLIA